MPIAFRYKARVGSVALAGWSETSARALLGRLDPALKLIAQSALIQGRKLDSGNPTPATSARTSRGWA